MNIFFKDTECRYIYATQICDLLNCGESGGTIVGKTDFEVQKFPDLAKQYYEDDQKLISNGGESCYISEFPMPDKTYFYEIHKKAVRDEEGGDEFLIICNNTTAQEARELIDQLKEKASRLFVKGNPLSIAYGTVTMQKEEYTYESDHRIADQRMYKMKQQMKSAQV